VGRSFVVRFPTRTLDAPCEAIEIVEDESPDPLGFKIRRPGITILPSIMAVTTCPAEGAARRAPSITFGDKELDSLTLRGDLAGGGCTLLATQNRCNSTAFGLHFLLGAIARSTQRESNDGGAGGAQPGLRSLLYLAIDQDLPGVLHDIWVYPDLRGAIWGNDVDRLAMQEAVSARLSGIRGETRGPSLWLFKIPLRHGACQVREGDGKKGMGPYLYVFTSDIAWCSQEELLERIGQVLDYARHGVDRACASCLTVDRVLFNRVSRVHTRWPLIEDAQVFVSSLAGMCRSRGIELMIIDDTAVQSETSGHISSHWTAISQNIIRLKRVPFHGSEAVALELVRCHGRSPRWNRTMELRSELTTRTASPGAQGHAWKLRLLDSFRGYTGLFSGNPKRCAVKVDLPYDRRGTALYRDMLNTRANLKTLIEGVDVNPELLTWDHPKMSAFAALSPVSRSSVAPAATPGRQSGDDSVPRRGQPLRASGAASSSAQVLCAVRRW